MNTQEYANVRLRKTTVQDLKIVASLAHESMIQTVQRLVAQEKERLEKERRTHEKGI